MNRGQEGRRREKKNDGPQLGTSLPNLEPNPDRRFGQILVLGLATFSGHGRGVKGRAFVARST